MTDTKSPCPPISLQDWPEELSALKGGFASKLAVYRVMAHDPSLLKAWAPLRDHVVVKTALGPERSEVVILRTGHHLQAEYEVAHHISRARAIGMDDARIASILGDVSAMTETDGLLAQAVDELFADAALSTETRDALMATLGKEAVFDLMATVGFYSTLGFIVKTFDAPIDDGVAAELRAKPLPR